MPADRLARERERGRSKPPPRLGRIYAVPLTHLGPPRAFLRSPPPGLPAATAMGTGAGRNVARAEAVAGLLREEAASPSGGGELEGERAAAAAGLALLEGSLREAPARPRQTRDSSTRALGLAQETSTTAGAEAAAAAAAVS